MLQKSLVGMAFKVNIGREKANLEEKNAAYCKKSLVETVLKVNVRKKKANLEEKNATCCKNLF